MDGRIKSIINIKWCHGWELNVLKPCPPKLLVQKINALKYFLILFAFLVALGCSEGKTTIHSPDGKRSLQVITKSDNSGKSFTYLYYTSEKDGVYTGDYVRARNRYSDAWYCLIEWKGAEVILHQPYSYFESDGIGASKIDIKRMDERRFFQLFFENTDRCFTRLSSIEEYNPPAD